MSRQSQPDEATFKVLVEKLEADARELGKVVEDAYGQRCNMRHLAECAQSNYDHCLSSFPDVTCLPDDAFRTPFCGGGETCSAFNSFVCSSVSLPKAKIQTRDGNPTDPQVIEDICYTRDLDEYFIKKREEDAEFWHEFGGQPSAMYFGSTTGAFRIYPARTDPECGEFDPTIRPWFVGASSGPKNIIMVLDKSGSMVTDDRIGLLKEAAKRVIDTAGVADRIGIVFFDDEAHAITDNGLLFRATQSNKQILKDAVDRLEARGGTNFVDAFKTAFDILDVSAEEELAVDCNTAMLFFTDGVTDDPHDDIIDAVHNRLAVSKQKLRNNPIYMFTYSITGGSPDVGELPSLLACSLPTSGIWTRIDYPEDIVDSLSSYYKFFALGLGSDVNRDYVSWSEPYIWYPGNTLGITVSVPVYDRTKNPPLFIGVVGIDLALAVLVAALGIDDSHEAFNRVIQRSTARCPRVELNECVIESYRRQGKAGDAALCSSNCTDNAFVQIEAGVCPFISDRPQNLWENTNLQGTNNVGCCDTESTEPSTECKIVADLVPVRIIVAIIFSGLVLLFCVGMALFGILRRRTSAATATQPRKRPLDTIPAMEPPAQNQQPAQNPQDAPIYNLIFGNGRRTRSPRDL